MNAPDPPLWRWPRLRTVLGGLFAVAAILVATTAIGTRQIEADLPPVGQFVEVDGVRLHYTDRGAGQPIVIVHGASSNLLEFERTLAPRLAKDHRVLTFDRPGYGYSDSQPGEWKNPGDIARLLLDASESLGAHRPVLVGHSWAGSVVMSALVREPERVAAGVLLSGAAGHWVPLRNFSNRIAEWPWLNAAFAHTLVYPVGRFLIPEALASVFGPQVVPEGHAGRVGAALALRPGSYLQNARDLLRLSRYLQKESTRYETIARPLLAIHGTGDELVPYWNHAERLTRVVGDMEVALLDGVGHAAHHVAPDGVSEIIRAFVARAVR